ncbi:MAG: DUF1385 domain-containing protein, partial [Candidatus Sumerlaeia bacterium]|nr:DUF1385 domain-containing protein [Candidatus Sumerlaeia bacterium]
IIGIRALNYSAREWEDSYKIMELRQKGKNETNTEQRNEKKKSENFSTFMALGIGLIMAIFLVIILPNLMTSYIGRIIPSSAGNKIAEVHYNAGTMKKYAPSEKSTLVEEHQPFLYNLITGIFRAGIIVMYVFLISRLKDIKRIFEYHGAEHKAVYAYEREGEVSIESARKYTTRHPRCGTSFLAIVILVSIIIFALIAQGVSVIWPRFTTQPFIIKKTILLGLHIIFLPLVAGTAYELIKLSGRYYTRFWLFKLLVLPGILFQKITTREPDDQQLEVAIAALNSALALKEQTNGTEGGAKISHA